MSRITDELIEDVQKYARAISNSGELYMDYAQDALTKIADKESEYDPSEAASFHTWATRIAIHEIIVREAKGFGRQKNYLQQYGESEYSLAFLPKVELLIWVDDDLADQVVQKIVSVARTGRIGDGKILVLPTFDAIDLV